MKNVMALSAEASSLDLPPDIDSLQEGMSRAITELMKQFAGSITRMEATLALEEVTRLHLLQMELGTDAFPIIFLPFGQLREQAFALLCIERAGAERVTEGMERGERARKKPHVSQAA